MIPYGRHCIDEDDIQAVVETLRQGSLTQGPKIAAFETEVARYVGAKFAVAVSSGTAALHVACMAANVGPGDNLVTTPNTFVASSNCALYVGAYPHFADINQNTLNLDPQRLAERCAELKSVKAVIPVHFAGLPCDMPAISAIAREYGAAVIEDASHALGAAYSDGGMVGNCAYADMTVFSFHPVKLIAAGEGGMITTNREDLYRKILRYRSHGINKVGDPFLETENAYEAGELNRWYYEMQEIGFNYRITDLQCALALSQFNKIERFIARRRQLADAYDRGFSMENNLRPAQLSCSGDSARHLYVVELDFDAIGLTRTRFMSALAEKGIGTQVHYIPVFMHPYYKRRGYDPRQFPATREYYRKALSIPLFYAMSDQQQTFVIENIKRLAQ